MSHPYLAQRYSNFGILCHLHLHRYRGVADAILERSRNAFYPLMATVSYFLFFLNFPAIQGPLLVYKVASSGASSSKRSPPEMSSGSSKRPCADPVGNCSTGDRFTTMDSFYWQYLLARSKVPISGITEVTKSGWLPIQRSRTCYIESVPVRIVWGPKPMPRFKKFDTFFPLPAQIEEARQRNNKGKSVDNG